MSRETIRFSVSRLQSSENSLDNQSTKSYNRSHGLLEIIDPLGRRIVRNIYDDQGFRDAHKFLQKNTWLIGRIRQGPKKVITTVMTSSRKKANWAI
jgi:hypothetical protein